MIGNVQKLKTLSRVAEHVKHSFQPLYGCSYHGNVLGLDVCDDSREIIGDVLGLGEALPLVLERSHADDSID